MRKSKYRVDTYPLSYFDLSGTPTVNDSIIVGGSRSRQMVLEDHLDELGEQGWEVVTVFVANNLVWRVARRTLWWRLWH